MTEAVKSVKGDDSVLSEPRAPGWGARILSGAKRTAFWATLGSPAAVTYSYAHNPEAPTHVHRNNGLKAVGGLAVINAAFGVLGFGGASVLGKGAEVLGMSNGVEQFAEAAQDPKTWYVLVGGAMALGLAKKGINSLSDRLNEARAKIAVSRCVPTES
jgi:hypothetical protein